jgi:uncharacterized membrane protein YhaH (DUF805 family)
MSRFEEVVFPKRLHRISYLVRIVIADFCLWLLLNIASPSDPTLGGLRLVAIFLGAFIIGIYSLFFVLLPRVRDAGWSGWWVLLGLLPYIGPLFHFVMLFVPPKRDLADEAI